MSKLIKLSELHYIIIDDSEIKNKDYKYCPLDDVVRIHKQSGQYYDFDEFKITHSTQPLEDGIGKAVNGTLPPAYPRFEKIKPLTLLEVEETINGYSVEKMAKEFVLEKVRTNSQSLATNIAIAFIEGFNTHKELVKDKLFTEQQLRDSIFKAIDIWMNNMTKDSSEINESEIKNIIQSLQKTEWNIELIEGKIKLI